MRSSAFLELRDGCVQGPTQWEKGANSCELYDTHVSLAPEKINKCKKKSSAFVVRPSGQCAVDRPPCQLTNASPSPQLHPDVPPVPRETRLPSDGAQSCCCLSVPADPRAG